MQPVQVGGDAGSAASAGSAAGPERWLRAWAGGAALCGRAAPELAGAWLCKAYNGFGDATLQLRLNVDADLNVTVAPSVVVSGLTLIGHHSPFSQTIFKYYIQVAEVGSTVTLNCSTNLPASLSWLHDGSPLQSNGARLHVRGVGRAHRGMYQCVATRGTRSAHAAAELRLAGNQPFY